MRNVLFIAVLMAGLSQGFAPGVAVADDSLPGDSRIKLLKYDETDVYTITTRYGYQTNIVFAPNEEIETISVGDRSVWQIIPAGNRMFIRPLDEDVITNMTVLTNKHSYQFDLKSVSAGKTEGNIYVAQFVYADEKKKSGSISAPPAPSPAPADAAPKQIYVPVPSPFTNAPSVPASTAANSAGSAEVVPGLNYSYTYAGSEDLAPVQVYDDGKTTTIKYRTLTLPFPTVLLVDPQGYETPAHYTVEDDVIRVDGVVSEMIVRTKDSAVHIYNEAMGSKPASGENVGLK